MNNSTYVSSRLDGKTINQQASSVCRPAFGNMAVEENKGLPLISNYLNEKHVHATNQVIHNQKKPPLDKPGLNGIKPTLQLANYANLSQKEKNHIENENNYFFSHLADNERPDSISFDQSNTFLGTQISFQCGNDFVTLSPSCMEEKDRQKCSSFFFPYKSSNFNDDLY